MKPSTEGKKLLVWKGIKSSPFAHSIFSKYKGDMDCNGEVLELELTGEPPFIEIHSSICASIRSSIHQLYNNNNNKVYLGGLKGNGQRKVMNMEMWIFVGEWESGSYSVGQALPACIQGGSYIQIYIQINMK